ncbi:arginine--tRNA ligase [Candidatus Babeliales bacterium]|nr:arginine--tRNA ligase [Candidatus Babeliales bacterium]
MNSFEQLKSSFDTFLHTLEIPANLITHAQFELNTDPEKSLFGDINSNVAMIAAKQLKCNPKVLAQQIVDQFQHPLVQKIEIAGPGFLNFFVHDQWFNDLSSQITQQQHEFFKPNIQPASIHLEFVSANPTGPMHVGHGRNGILGDVLARILTFLGNSVHKEFYINDAGAQITKLGHSFKIRCLQQLGHDVSLPEDAYHGLYLEELAQNCVTEFGKNLELEPETFFQNYAKMHLLQQLQITLENYGIIFDQWFSEKSLHDHGQITQALDRLVRSGHTYEQDGALWFRSTTFGDDKDRVMRKANGELTYVAADVAYLIDKLDRGYEQLIMVLGHDHHSYKIRLESIMQALGYDHKHLHVILYQLVHVLKDGQPVRMSKRTGNMVTLEEVIQEVGKDIARFFFLYRKADAELQFDIDLALKQSNENPLFYIQYAHVRTMSIQKKAMEAGIDHTNVTLDTCNQSEKLILKKICQLKYLLPQIAQNHQIHLLAHFTYELSHLFHAYYNQQRIIDTDNPATTQHRLAIVNVTQKTLQTAFYIMGITPLDTM